jgi:hypothetical protein
MRWHLTVLLLGTSFACSPTQDSKEEPVKREIHTQPASVFEQAPTPIEVPGGQTFKEGMVALCESFEKAPKSEDAAESQKLLHGWLTEHVTNEKVREVFSLVGKMPASQRSGMLRAAAAKVGIESCALAGPDPLETAAPVAAE